MSPLLWFLASLLVRLWCELTRPSTFTCPRGTSPMGVRPSGHTTCDVVPEDDDSCYRDNPCSFPNVPDLGLEVRVF